MEQVGAALWLVEEVPSLGVPLVAGRQRKISVCQFKSSTDVARPRNHGGHEIQLQIGNMVCHELIRRVHRYSLLLVALMLGISVDAAGFAIQRS